MATGYKYNGVDIARLTAKSKGEMQGTKIAYINPKESNHTFSAEATYYFIPYTTQILNGIWASKRVAYADVYKDESGESNQIAKAAAWGSAPMPKRSGLSNTTSGYINTQDLTFKESETVTLEWGTGNEGDTDANIEGIRYSNDTYNKKLITVASCIVIDVVAKGGDGGHGYYRDAYKGGGGGGGSGATASLLIDMTKAGKIVFVNTSSALTVKYELDKGNGSTILNTFLTLEAGKNGSNGSFSSYGYGGAGGKATEVSLAENTLKDLGINILWVKDGATGGQGAGGNLCTSSIGDASPETITFIEDNTIIRHYGGNAAGCLASSTEYYCWGGGGGGASIFSGGGHGGGKVSLTSGFSPTNGYSGSGGGGGYVLVSDGTTYENNQFVLTEAARAGKGGSAYARFYYESDVAEPIESVTNTTTPTNPSTSPLPDSGGGGLCIFPGTQIFLDKDTSIDIVDFKGGTPIDFCNPDTLEHFPQQTLARLYSSRATKKITIWLEDGKTVSLTPDHAVLTKEGFKTYTSTVNMFPLYTVGDKVATVDGYKKIMSLQEENIDASIVYNIITENSLMVANGIIIASELNYVIDPTAVTNPDISKDQWGNDSGGGSGIIP